jgi:GNAT superfamily N-acetyltransferase
MELVVAEGRLLEEILDCTYPLWNEGLTRHAYAQWNAAQMRTAWGKAHLHRVALVDADGALLATAKRYRFTARAGGRTVPVLGIGALFTPEPLRRRTYATSLVERLVAEARDDGAQLAMLFSEIGTGFYERLSFRATVLDEVRIGVKLKDGAPAMLVRAGHESDLPSISAMHDVRSASARFALQRDPALLHFVLARRRLLAGLGRSDARQVEFHVAEEGASAVAYVVLSNDAHGWTLGEAGDRDPSGARLGALLQVLLAREPSQPRPVIRAWWPRQFEVPPQLQLMDRCDARDVLMMRPLADGIALPSSADDVFYWRGDVF